MASEAVAHDLHYGLIENVTHASFCLMWASSHIVKLTNASIARKSTEEQNLIARAALDWLITFVSVPDGTLAKSSMPVPDIHQLRALRIGTMVS